MVACKQRNFISFEVADTYNYNVIKLVSIRLVLSNEPI